MPLNPTETTQQVFIITFVRGYAHLCPRCFDSILLRSFQQQILSLYTNLLLLDLLSGRVDRGI
jgi:hypothetical protein